MLQHIKTLIATIIVLSTFSGSASATKMLIIQGSEKLFVSGTISHGSEPIDIRVVSIHDSSLVSAIRKGSRSRKIRILIDKESSEIESLIGFRNVDIRISTPERKAWFGSRALKKSFLMVREKGGSKVWDGKLSWTSGTFGNQIRFYISSSMGPDQGFRGFARTFDYEFSLAQKLSKPATVAPSHKPFLL